MSRKEHWNQVYQTREAHDLSWFQPRPNLSLELIEAAGLAKDAGIIDVGSGISTLVDSLIEAGYSRLALLDVSDAALSQTQSRLGPGAGAVECFATDVISFSPPTRFALWHDRAVFHFLTQAEERRGYVAALQRSLQPGGTAIIATFAPDGPPKCSGLDVMRYDERSILTELGPEFQLQEIRRETHVTPWQSEQRFIYFRFQRS